MSDGPDSPAAGNGDADDEAAREARRMRRALSAIRREGWKVAVIYATLDAALAAMGANFLLTLWRPSFLPAEVALPAALVETLGPVSAVLFADGAVRASALVAVAVGLLVFAVEVAVRVRRPLVEQFEAVNPGLRESLRTARDAVEDGRRTRMARRLYDDVLSELRSASSIELLDTRKLTVTVVLLAVVSLASIQLAAVDLSLGGGSGPGAGNPTDAETPAEYRGLQDPSSILGETEAVPTGQESMDAVVGTSGSGSGDDAADAAGAFDDSGFGDPGAVESQQAGFAEVERLEDAALIREYNLRIREGGDG